MPRFCATAMTGKPYAPYAARNAEPILKVLRDEFSESTRVLEIGSGTAQHAVAFAGAMPHLIWQTSDLDENHPGILEWLQSSGLENVLPPLSLDVRSAQLEASAYDAVFSANTAHIMSRDAVAAMFRLVGQALGNLGVFCLYGPFRQCGEFNTPSNAAFHETLRLRNPEMGIRNLEDLDAMGVDNGLQRQRLYAMPANNNVAVWKRLPR